MIRLLAFALLFPRYAVAFVEAPNPTSAQHEEAATTTRDEAYDALNRAYEGALNSYDQQRLDASRGQAEVPKKHPARSYWARFEALAAQGSVASKGWLAANVDNSSDDVAEKGRRLQALVDDLLATAPDSDVLMNAVTGVRAVGVAIGLDKAARLCEQIQEKCTVPEVRARALFVKAWAVSDRSTATDEKRVAEARELYRTIVLGFAGTQTAQEAASYLFPTLQRELLAAEKRWIEDVRALQSKGRPPSEWPRQPLENTRNELLPLAAAHHVEARQICETFYPAYEQVESLGPGQAGAWLVREINPQLHRGASDPDWAPIRMGILARVLDQFPSDPWVLPALRTTLDEAPQMPPLVALEPAQIAQSARFSPEARALALSIEAATRRRAPSEVELTRALEIYHRIVAEYPDQEGTTEKAQKAIRELSPVMPGQPIPEPSEAGAPIKDVDGLDVFLRGYRGKVLLIDFATVLDPTYEKDAADRVALATKLAGKPFAMLGIYLDRITLKSWEERAKALHINWRSVLLQTPIHLIVPLMQLHHGTCTFLVDADGVLRARERPWAEMAKMAEELTAKVH